MRSFPIFLSTLIVPFLLVKGLRPPIKRPDGSLYFPGRGCGISEPFKHVSKLPNDTSSLKCVFYKKELHYPRKPDFSRCFMYDTKSVGYTLSSPQYKDGVVGPEDCQKECVLHSNCDDFTWRVLNGRCYFLKGGYTGTAPQADPQHVLGPKRCSADTYA